MADETRKLLKLFGVVVTDFKAEAEKLAAAAGQLCANSRKEEVAQLLQNAAELCRELNHRWLETIQHRVPACGWAAQERLLATCAEAAARVK